jgi:methylthioadenosine phosphorylase (EC 2.4.2.28)
MLGIIGGTSLLFCDLPQLDRQRMYTPYGPADLRTGEVILLLRHQDGIPPHCINHRAHLAALALAGADHVISIGSVGSLQPEIPPGSLLIPDDYVTFGEVPTIHDHAIVHLRPEISTSLREDLASVVPEARSGGVYVQTRGPRLETRAEVRMLSRIGDVVGMTLASEATLALELGLSFAALCTVDNYAHGIGKEVPSYEHILTAARGHQDRTREQLARIIERLG